MEIKPSKYHLPGHNRKKFKKQVQSHMIPTLLMASLTDADTAEIKHEREVYDKVYDTKNNRPKRQRKTTS